MFLKYFVKYPINLNQSLGSHVNKTSKHSGLNGGGPCGHLHIGEPGGPCGHLHIGEPPEDTRVLNYD